MDHRPLIFDAGPRPEPRVPGRDGGRLSPGNVGVGGMRLTPDALLVIRPSRRRVALADEAATPALGQGEQARIDTLLRRYKTGTAQRTPEIREEIRAYFRALGRTSPI